MNHIANAVEPLRSSAIARAESEAIKVIERIVADLEAHDWDARIAAPFPGHNLDRKTFVSQKAKYDMYRAVTGRKDSSSLTPRSPDYRIRNQEREQAFINRAKEDASSQYDAFIAKLNEKVGNCVSASLSGDHVWGYSFMTVTKDDGSVERWKTQMIINVSKLGNMFNQYPTRKVK